MNRVIGLITTNYASKQMGVLTEERTIASLPFASRYRLIDFPLSNMVNSGINTVGIITPYKYRSIIDHIGAGKEWALDRKSGGLFVLPGTIYGISSADSRFLLRDIKHNLVYLNRSPAPYVIVTSSNTICNMDYSLLLEEHLKTGADITLVYNYASEDDDHSIRLEAEGGSVTGIAHGVKAGDKNFLETFIISRDLLLKISEWYAAVDYLDIFEILADDLDKMDVRTYEFSGYARSVYTVQEYFKHSMELLDPAVNDELFSKSAPILTKVLDTVPTKYVKGASVRNSLLPAGCVIAGAVEGSVLFGGVKVEEGAVIKNSIVMQGCVIKSGARIENAIIDRNNIINPGCVIKGSPDAVFVEEKKFL